MLKGQSQMSQSSSGYRFIVGQLVLSPQEDNHQITSLKWSLSTMSNAVSLKLLAGFMWCGGFSLQCKGLIGSWVHHLDNVLSCVNFRRVMIATEIAN